MDEVMYVNLDNIVGDSNISSVVKMAAFTVKSKTYLLPGEFFENLPDSDLKYLSTLCDAIVASNKYSDQLSEDAQAAMHDLGALSVVLQLGEGKSIFNTEDFASGLSATIMFVALEQLSRKNLIEVNRSNFSYIDDDKEIARFAGN